MRAPDTHVELTRARETDMCKIRVRPVLSILM